MNIINARVLMPDGVLRWETIHTQGSRFSAVGDGINCDALGLTAIPGLIDTHLHGAQGRDFMEGSLNAIAVMAEYEARCGVTAICPATMTMDEAAIIRACQAGAAFVPTASQASMIGIYLEGPFVSPDWLGAQNPHFVQQPSADFFHRAQQAAGGRIKVLALAPETDPQFATLRALCAETVIAIAHTGCDYDTAMHAYKLGARRLTHVFNAMPGIHHRRPGPILAAMDHPGCMAEIICDGLHLHPAAVRAAFRLFGSERMIMISDSMMAAGLGDGSYTLGGQTVSVHQGRALLADGTLAGSATNLFTCLQRAVQEMDIPLEQAVAAATSNPARSLGLEDELGCIAPAAEADLLLIDADLQLQGVMLRGQWQAGHPFAPDLHPECAD